MVLKRVSQLYWKLAVRHQDRKKKQFLTQKNMKKRLTMAKNTDPGLLTTRRRFFRDEVYLFVQGYKSSVVRQSYVETLLPDHIQQTAKHPSK
ncbi:hypothetical protein TNCV_3756881 [Trichonephila clavipes]|nr:hypothetical protein TNCV_3756881 [Trichonephila clavipes]